MSERPVREPHAIRIVEDRWTTFRHVIEAVAIIAAGLWAFYTFVYQEKIKPAGEPAALDPTILVQRVGHDAKREVLRVTVQWRNTGQTEIDIAADGWNLYGERYGPRPVHHTVDQDGNLRDETNALPIVSRTLLRAYGQLRDAAVGGLTGDHIVIEPGTTTTYDDPGGDVIVPRGRYDVIDAEIIGVPVKTPVRRKVHITMTRSSRGGVWFRSNEVTSSDTRSSTSLIP
ncbi:MAG TPA: hypothetical protein VMD91_17115 [Candidatus Sulfotelmatobacter sp.]|nr:hypothetical protein [Candidatus Sulfotelmatobacter sp.]